MAKSITNLLKELGVKPTPEAKALLHAWGQQRLQEGIDRERREAAKYHHTLAQLRKQLKEEK